MFNILDRERQDKVKVMVAAAPGLESNVDDQSTSRVHIPFMSLTVDVPWLRKIFYSDISLKLMGPRETDAYDMGKLMGLTSIAVRKRFDPDALPQRDMLGSSIRHGLTQQACESESLFMFVAGSDTTAAAIRITMLHVLSNPGVYHSLKAEVKRAIQEGKVSTPITSAEGRALQYLQPVIYEGLRIRPIISGLIFKPVPLSGDTINGKFLPGGTAVGTNMSCFLRNKHTFSEDADIFCPERFLELDSDGLAEMRRNVELQFGYGRWMCAGKPLAQID
ncbi:putative Pisatin demethylase 7 [Seiridium cardinale]